MSGPSASPLPAPPSSVFALSPAELVALTTRAETSEPPDEPRHAFVVVVDRLEAETDARAFDPWTGDMRAYVMTAKLAPGALSATLFTVYASGRVVRRSTVCYL